MMLGTAFFTTVMGMTYGGYATGTSPELGTDFKLKGSKFAMKKTLGYGTGTLNIPYGDRLTSELICRMLHLIQLLWHSNKQLIYLQLCKWVLKIDDQVDDYLEYLLHLYIQLVKILASSTFMSGVGKAISDYQTFENLGFKKGGERWGKILE